VLASASSVALVGTDAYAVEVEVFVGGGVPRFSIVGLPTKSVREAEQRVRSALESSGYKCPQVRIVANLAPGALRKEGTHFDLPIAVGIYAAANKLKSEAFGDWMMLGELALDGSVRPVRGVLAAAMQCRSLGRRGILCPASNAPEAALVDDIDVVSIANLRECVGFVRGEWTPPEVERPPEPEPPPVEDMSEIRGHDYVKRAAEIAIAGGHNLLMVGPPGSGKTMLARRVPGIAPEMTIEESLEVTRIYSVAGMLSEHAAIVRQRPFRSPHQGVSLAGLVGGGSGVARPGEVSLAHNGVLFLDELALYRRDVLESLRGPAEDGVVRIARSGGVISYPCRFSLIAAMNPCPCGHSGDDGILCRCTERELELYRARLSGPLLDRFDVQVKMLRTRSHELLGDGHSESSESIRGRVTGARAIQRDRYESAVTTNASAPKRAVERTVHLSPGARDMLRTAIDTLSLSGRGLDRVRRIARTIADLQRSAEVGEDHFAEALLLRSDGRVLVEST
jgi:magnesium chelatase family protein